jgi:glycerophosphoryl diester phosphodiesterase
MLVKHLLSKSSKPVMISHRGGKEQENKISAFRRSITQGFKMMECDVRMSKDKVPVVIHDKTIDRTTSSRGFVHNMTSCDLKIHEIPLFEELVSLLVEQVHICLAVEIKERDLELLSKVLEIIHNYRVGDRCMIISFRKLIVRSTKDLQPAMLTGLVYGPVRTRCAVFLTKKNKADYLILHHQLINDAIVEKAKKEEKPLLVWTVNDQEDFKRLSRYNLAGIITDYEPKNTEN